MRSFGQLGSPGGQGPAVYSGTSAAGPSGHVSGQSGSFLGSLGIGGQPGASEKGAGDTTFKGKAHTLGELLLRVSSFKLGARFQVLCLMQTH